MRQSLRQDADDDSSASLCPPIPSGSKPKKPLPLLGNRGTFAVRDITSLNHRLCQLTNMNVRAAATSSRPGSP